MRYSTKMVAPAVASTAAMAPPLLLRPLLFASACCVASDDKKEYIDEDVAAFSTACLVVTFSAMNVKGYA